MGEHPEDTRRRALQPAGAGPFVPTTPQEIIPGTPVPRTPEQGAPKRARSHCSPGTPRRQQADHGQPFFLNLLSRAQLHNLMDRIAAELQSRGSESPASAVTEEADPAAAQANLDRLLAEWPTDSPLPGSSSWMLPSFASSAGAQPHLPAQDTRPGATEEATFLHQAEEGAPLHLPVQEVRPESAAQTPVATGWPPRLPDRSLGYGLPRAANPDPDSSSDTGSSVHY